MRWNIFISTAMSKVNAYTVMLLVAAFALIGMCGCATPSRIIERWNEKGQLTERETEYKNSTFYSGKAVGLKIGYDPESYSPIVKIIYGRYESARIYQGMAYDSDYGLVDVGFFSGAGEASHKIKMTSDPKKE